MTSHPEGLRHIFVHQLIIRVIFAFPYSSHPHHPNTKHTILSQTHTDDDHWVIDTDYDNYAIHYSCREIDTDGTCLDGYSFIFSRHPTGLRPEDQVIVTRKKQEICFLGKYRRVTHTGKMAMTYTLTTTAMVTIKGWFLKVNKAF